ncbi:MAG: leucine-rich repeat domain-containing protein [Coriobacteriia bacterium]|nr:leucine-rich repeat domain-containing protein [Coriobacteriia bacterium]
MIATALAATALALCLAAPSPAYAGGGCGDAHVIAKDGTYLKHNVSFDEAMACALENPYSTVQLCSSIYLSKSYTINRPITLDLHRHRLGDNFRSDYLFTVQDGGTLNIVDTGNNRPPDDPQYPEDLPGTQGELADLTKGFYVSGFGKLNVTGCKLTSQESMILSNVGAEVTVTDSELVSESNDYDNIALELFQSSTFTMTGGSFTETGANCSPSYAIFLKNSAALTVNGTKLTAPNTSVRSTGNAKVDLVNATAGRVQLGDEGSTTKSTLTNSAVDHIMASGGKLTVNSGTYGALDVYNKADVTVKGGTFKGYDSYFGKMTATYANTSNLKVYGGTFTSFSPWYAFGARAQDDPSSSPMCDLTTKTSAVLPAGYAFYQVKADWTKTLVTSATKFASVAADATTGHPGTFGLHKPGGLPAGTYTVGKCTHRVSSTGTTCLACGKQLKGTDLAGGTGETLATYRMTSGSTAQYVACKTTCKTVTIPSTVKLAGRSFKVTSIAAKACEGKKMTKVLMGANVKSIGTKAFYKCASLKSASISAACTSLGASCFSRCSKLSTITLKTAKLTSAKTGSYAFSKVYKYAKVKCTSKTRAKAYKKWIFKKGLPKTAKVTA